MSYALQLYAIDWQFLAALLGNAEEALLERLAARDGELYPGDSEEAAGRRIVFRKTLQALLTGPRGRRLAARGPLPSGGEVVEVSDVAAVAFATILASAGQPVGALDHSAGGGPLFRAEFIERYGLSLLVERPLFGIIHATYPSWGGLRREEIAARLATPLPRSGDDDIDVWTYNLLEALAACAERDMDLATIYW